MPPKFEHVPCVLMQSDDWTARPVSIRSFGGRSVGFDNQIPLQLSLLSYQDSSPRLELKFQVPKAVNTPATYFGPKLETGAASANYNIIVKLDAASIKRFRWQLFTAAELDIPADAKMKGAKWMVYEFTVSKPPVQGWPMPFESRVPETDACFQRGYRLGNLSSTMAQLVGENGIITIAAPDKPKNPRPSDIKRELDKGPFAYFGYGRYVVTPCWMDIPYNTDSNLLQSFLGHGAVRTRHRRTPPPSRPNEAVLACRRLPFCCPSGHGIGTRRGPRHL